MFINHYITKDINTRLFLTWQCRASWVVRLSYVLGDYVDLIGCLVAKVTHS